MGGLLAGIGKAVMGGLGALGGGGGGGGGGDGGGEAKAPEGGGGGGGDAGGILKGVGDLVTGIIGAAKGNGEAPKEGEARPPEKKDPLAQLQAKLDQANEKTLRDYYVQSVCAATREFCWRMF